ncbi:MAG: hypothetical protein GY946_08765 [bacterium]|nr:hypothetical protein [bacterium]
MTLRANPSRKNLLRVLFLLVSLAWLLAATCGGPPTIKITSPSQSTFTNDASVLVTGTIANVSAAQMVEVRVNGTPVVVTAGSWSTTVALDSVAVFNPIVAELELTSTTKRDRVTVVAGDGVTTGYVLDGGFSPESVGLRLNDGALDDIESVVTDLVDFDPSTMISVGTLVIEDYCAVSLIWCIGWVDVYVANPPPTISGFGIDIDSLTGAVAGDVNLDDLQVDLDIVGTGVAPSCGLRVTAAQTDILGDYDLAPDPGDPSAVDVNQVGIVDVVFSSFNDEFTSGICDFPLIGDLIQLIIGDVQPMVEGGLEDFMNDPDGAGPLDGPVADAIEVALAEISIAGDIGAAIGVNMEAPLVDIVEDTAGLTLQSDSSITASLPLPEAPDLPASYTLETTFPVFGATAPGGSPYGIGIGISPSAFNQLLKAEIESGLLISTLTEFDLGYGPIPLTAGFLGAFLPELLSYPVSEPMVINLAPKLAPIITANPGPAGELLELKISDLEVVVELAAPANTRFLVLAVDADLGVDLSFAGGVLSFVISEVATQDIGITIRHNSLGTNEASLLALLPVLLAQALPTLGDSLGAFPIPGVLGFDLSPVEVAKNGDFVGIYADLVPAP